MSKKAVIQTGGKQYVVAEGETIAVELIKDIKSGKVSFIPLMVMDGKDVALGKEVKATVSAEVVAEDAQADKVTSIRYKAKKRVHTVRGHRQHQTHLKITKIA
jgi:large subunit ribosomal protein L21